MAKIVNFVINFPTHHGTTALTISCQVHVACQESWSSITWLLTKYKSTWLHWSSIAVSGLNTYCLFCCAFHINTYQLNILHIIIIINMIITTIEPHDLTIPGVVLTSSEWQWLMNFFLTCGFFPLYNAGIVFLINLHRLFLYPHLYASAAHMIIQVYFQEEVCYLLCTMYHHYALLLAWSTAP